MPVLQGCSGSFFGRSDGDNIVIDLRKDIGKSDSASAERAADAQRARTPNVFKWLFSGRTFGLSSAQSNPEPQTSIYAPLFRSR